MPGTSAPVERVFSLMNASWTDEKSRLSVTTKKAMFFVRINFGLDCSAFYNKLLKDKRTLVKIGSSEKYKTASVNDAVPTDLQFYVSLHLFFYIANNIIKCKC